MILKDLIICFNYLGTNCLLVNHWHRSVHCVKRRNRIRINRNDQFDVANSASFYAIILLSLILRITNVAKKDDRKGAIHGE